MDEQGTAFERRVLGLLQRVEPARTGSRLEAGQLRPLGAKARRTRTNLLAHAYERFVAHGYAGTSVTDIHEAAGVSLGTFYTYFRSKADVMLTLVGEVVATSSEHLLGAGPRVEGPVPAAEMVEPFVRHYEANADFQRVWEEVTHVEAHIARFRWDLSDLIDTRLRLSIELGQRAGLMNRALDPSATARALNAMVDRTCYRTFVVDGRRGEREVRRTVGDLAGIWTAALAAR